MKRRFHHWVRCTKCGRTMVKDRTLADAWVVDVYGLPSCKHNFVTIRGRHSSLQLAKTEKENKDAT